MPSLFLLFLIASRLSEYVDCLPSALSSWVERRARIRKLPEVMRRVSSEKLFESCPEIRSLIELSLKNRTYSHIYKDYFYLQRYS